MTTNETTNEPTNESTNISNIPTNDPTDEPLSILPSSGRGTPGTVPSSPLTGYPPEDCGIIPRVLFELFRTLSGEDHLVKVSFLELYNEELRDLLSSDDAKLRIYDKAGQIHVQNLSEEHVCTSADGLRLLARGLQKRKTAATKLNDASLRSHTIFTVSLHRKLAQGEWFRASKMNLVDLAGSENISRSGAVKERAKEAGSINQSLLALGRVINVLSGRVDENPGDRDNKRDSQGDNPRDNQGDNPIDSQRTKASSVPMRLSEGSMGDSFGARNRMVRNGRAVKLVRSDVDGHTPYRESKLTRLLQDSLGGNTKTTLIATISPAKINVDETLLTLEYALRAKNIRNAPQAGSESDLVLKKVLVKNLSHELSRMLYDLAAARARNGVYLDEANYGALMDELELLRLSVKEGEVREAHMRQALMEKNAELAQRNETVVELERELTAMRAEKEQMEKRAAGDREEIKRLNTSVSTHEAEIALLNANVTEQATLLSARETKIARLTNHMAKINDKFNTTTAQLTSIIYDNLSESIASIEGLVRGVRESTTAHDLGVLGEHVARFQKGVRERMTGVNHAHSELNDKLAQFVEQYNGNLLRLGTVVAQLNANFMDEVRQLQATNTRWGTFIRDEHLDHAQVEAAVQRAVEQRLGGELGDLGAQVEREVGVVLGEAHRRVESFFANAAQSITGEVVDHHRARIKEREQQWSAESLRALAQINVSALRGLESNEREWTELKEQLTTMPLPQEEIPTSKVELRLHSIREKILHSDKHLGGELEELGRKLGVVSGFDARAALMVSPERDDSSEKGESGIRKIKERTHGSPQKIKGRLNASPQKGRLNGSPEKDRFIGSQKTKDRFIGSQKDRFVGSPQKDRLIGSPPKDRLIASPKKDRLVGSPQRDRLVRNSQELHSTGPGAPLSDNAGTASPDPMRSSLARESVRSLVRDSVRSSPKGSSRPGSPASPLKLSPIKASFLRIPTFRYENKENAPVLKKRKILREQINGSQRVEEENRE